jgi:hypothetical protein
MTAVRKDWMGDCLNDLAKKAGTPLTPQELKASFCDFCTQPECTRSLYGTSRFEKRVSTWQERLFTHVPRMDARDPRFSDITSKGFVIINPESLTKSYESAGGDWVDPRDIKTSSVSVPVAVEHTPAPPAEEIPAATTQEPESRTVPREVILMNTPTQRGIMLPGGNQKVKPSRDAWDAPQPVKAGEKVVQSGATVKFGVQSESAPKSDEGDSQP